MYELIKAGVAISIHGGATDIKERVFPQKTALLQLILA